MLSKSAVALFEEIGAGPWAIVQSAPPKTATKCSS